MTAVRLPDGNRTAVIDFITVFFSYVYDEKNLRKGKGEYWAGVKETAMFVGFIFLAAAPLLMSDSVSSRCLASVKTSAVICLIDFFPRTN